MLPNMVIIMRNGQNILARNAVSRLDILRMDECIFMILDIGDDGRQINVLQLRTK